MTPAPRSSPRASSAAAVSWPVRVAASWSWRLVFIAVVVLGLFRLVGLLFVVVVPIGLALLASALLTPAVGWLQRRGMPRGVATVLVMVGGIVLVVGVFGFVIRAFADGLPDLQEQVTASIESIRDWLITGPLGLSQGQLTQASDSLVKAIRTNQEALTSSAFATAATVSELLSGALLALFTLIFFLHDGRGIWRFLIRVVPGDVRDAIDVAGQRGFASLVGYVRATVAVAAVDAIGIGVGLAVLGVPLALPLDALVFLGAFVPIVGAVVTGLVAVLVALVAKGFVVAVVVLGVVLVVMQVEGHVLQPFLMGRAVKLHPLAVVVSIATGLVLGGVIGALLVVPAVAFLNAAVRSLQHPSDPPEQPGPPMIDVTDVDQATPGSQDDAAAAEAVPGDLSEAGAEAADREQSQH